MNNAAPQEREFRVEANGFDINTGEPSIPECYVMATGCIEAAQILSAFLASGAHAEKVRLVKKEKL